MKVSFVVPSYNNFQLVNQLLVDIHEHTKADEVIVVDDCSTDEVAVNGLAWWASNYGVRVMRPVENLGFLKSSNYGMKAATGGIICLVSTDVRILGDVITPIENTLKESLKTLFGGIVYRDSTGWNEFKYSGFTNKIFHYAEGWFLATGKEQWEELGYFDERYAPHDFEDVDLSTKAVSMGYNLFSMPSGLVKHTGAATIGYTDARRELTEKNRKIFEEKWLSQN
jgi:GT2 family glycosyltransferase